MANFPIPDDDHNDPESSGRTRSRLEIEPTELGIPLPPRPRQGDQDSQGELDLNLTLGISSSQPSPEQPQSPLPQPQIPPLSPPSLQSEPEPEPEPQLQTAPAPRRCRRNPTNAPGPGKSLTIQPPFPWATNRRAHVHRFTYLMDRGIKTISGEVQCKRCEQWYQIEYDLEERFSLIASYITENKHDLRHRAPPVWLNPTLLRCNFCHQENSVKPKIAAKKRSINWLFLLLGQMIGCCTLEQLKYFCKHTAKHRTGAKDRIVYLTYLGLCKQVDPSGPFDVFEPPLVSSFN